MKNETTLPIDISDYVSNDIPSPVPAIVDMDIVELTTIQHGKPQGSSYVVLPLRDKVVFPHIVQTVAVSDPELLEMLMAQANKEKYIVTLAIRSDADLDEDSTITSSHLCHTGVLCSIENIVHTPSDITFVLLRGVARIEVSRFTQNKPYIRCHGTCKYFSPTDKDLTSTEGMVAITRLRQALVELMTSRAEESYPKDFIEEVGSVDEINFLLYFAAAYVSVIFKAKQEILEIDSAQALIMRLLSYIEQEIELRKISDKIAKQTRWEMDEQQKKYFLEQQIRTIRDELGYEDKGDSVLEDLKEKAKQCKWSEETQKVFDREMSNLERLLLQAPEYSIQLQYLQLMVNLPWGVYSDDQFDLQEAERILNRDHFGLDKVKERILEHLAVLKLKADLKSPIICLYGPPGVGKTSLGKSIAECLGRKYVRISLGGLHDEAEIRGHRRTYIGAMCGRIIDGIKRAGTSNPVFVLDEIDKISSDYKGDPSAALLEVLDPEQNIAFHDNYLDVDFDLSKVLFIATANTLSTISVPLLDRMELISVSGYLLEEKIEIAKKHLIPKELESHGVTADQFSMSDEALTHLIDGYTRESGVRSLQKQLATLLRKQAKKIAFGEKYSPKISEAQVEEYLKTPPYSRDLWQDFGMPGIVTGLAWTQVGGEILFIESSTHQGKDGRLTLTGNLGDVMKESAVIALDYIKAHRDEIGIPTEALENVEIHLHVPEGAIPKDGPSAGITMATSLVSTLTKRHVKPRIAMTGEITLTGRVLPVGGIKEKILAAKRAGVSTIILSKENEKDIKEIKPIYVDGVTFHYVDNVMQVLDLALEQ